MQITKSFCICKRVNTVRNKDTEVDGRLMLPIFCSLKTNMHSFKRQKLFYGYEIHSFLNILKIKESKIKKIKVTLNFQTQK